MTHRQLLAADIGGTHARFMHMPESQGPLPARLAPLELNTREYPDLPGLLAAALAALHLKAADCDAVFAVAGPVREGRVRLTNLGWDLDEAALRRASGFHGLHLLNDLAAAAWCLGEDPPRPARVLREAKAPQDGRSMVASVSTGLGIAYWSRLDGKLRVDAAEGGHTGFAPGDLWETGFLRTLQERHGGRISWERMLSGSGLAVLEAHLRGGAELEPAEVTRRAIAGDDCATRAVQRFSRMIGAFVGDRVLAAPITGGIWLMGGVLAGLGEHLDRDRFLEGMDSKGRLTSDITQLPVRVTDDDFLGLKGAYYAARAFLR